MLWSENFSSIKAALDFVCGLKPSQNLGGRVVYKHKVNEDGSVLVKAYRLPLTKRQCITTGKGSR